MFDSLTLYIAFAPLAVYFVLIGLMNLSRQPLLVAGERDLSALLAAMTGLIIVGPMEVVFPTNAAWNFGCWVWLVLLAIYMLTCFLIVVAQRPSVNIYNIVTDELRPVLSSLAVELDPTARWAGNALSLPALGVHLYLDENRTFRNVSLLAAGGKQNPVGWRLLTQQLAAKLKTQLTPIDPSRKRYVGVVLLTLGILTLIGLHLMIWFDSEAFLKAIPDWLRI